MYISPRHFVSSPDGFPKTLEDQIDLIFAQIDGWHLEVADRCINGWNIKEKQSIDTVNLLNQQTNHVPDAGWAVLQMVLNYFETIAWLKLGSKSYKSKHYELFEWGVLDVFPELENRKSEIKKILWGQFRTGLYHYGPIKGNVVLTHTVDTQPLIFDDTQKAFILDPHKFIPKLRTHFREYCDRLNDTNESDLRDKFKVAYEASRK